MSTPYPDEPFAVFGLSAYSGNWSGASGHSHPELELHLVSESPFILEYSGRRTHLSAGRIHAFWGIRRHRTLDDRRRSARHHVIRIPLTLLWQWELPPDFVHTLLSEIPGELGAERWVPDPASWMSRMVELVKSPNPLCQRAVEAHMKAFLFEAASWQKSGSETPTSPPVSHALARRLESVVLALSNPSRHRPSIAAAAERAGLHRVTACKVFRQMTGLSLREFVMSLRVQYAAWLLHHTPHSIGEVAERCGFSTVPRFHAAFLKRIGKTPGAFRQER